MTTLVTAAGRCGRWDSHTEWEALLTLYFQNSVINSSAVAIFPPPPSCGRVIVNAFRDVFNGLPKSSAVVIEVIIPAVMFSFVDSTYKYICTFGKCMT